MIEDDREAAYFMFGIFCGIVMMGIVLVCPLYLLPERAAQREREKALEAGVGRWVVDPLTGSTEFRYGKGN